MTGRESLAVAVLVTPPLGILAAVVTPERLLARVETAIACLTAVAAAVIATVALVEPSERELGRWIVLDPAGGVLLGVIGAIGLTSALVSVQYLRERRSSLFRTAWADRIYWATLFAFWTVLLAVPLAGNLGAAWLAIEATTAASALLVGFSGRARALEAGWKYLILTSLGLGIALLGMLVLEGSAGGGGIESLTWRSLPQATLDPETTVVAYVLLLGGLAAKIGWAPVHNWLPDAHSEAPAPISALLSAALLPAVLLVAWRTQQALAPTIGVRTAGGVLVGFGLASLAVAVPFLWRSQAWKRLLAYSSLEHMGVIALGIGFGTPLALAGVAVHIAAHAVAKATGFYAATPLIAHEPRATERAVTGIARTFPALGSVMGISLGALAGLPPSPLFFSEVLIVAGGFEAGRSWAAGATAFLLALGFLGLAHALLETTVGKARRRDATQRRERRTVAALGGLSLALLLGLSAAALWLPGSSFVAALLEGLS